MTDLVQRLRTEWAHSDLTQVAADRIEALERENAANERNLCQLTDELAAARRENAELRKDAERYRWIRTANPFRVERILDATAFGTDTDAAIDEAMKS